MRKAGRLVLQFVKGLVGEPMGVFAGILLMFLMGAVVFEVIARYFFTRPTMWSVQVTSYLVVASVFLPLGYIALKDGHINVDLVISRLSERVRVRLQIATTVMFLIYAAIFTCEGLKLTWRAYEAAWRSPEGIPIPLFPAYLVMPIGTGLLCAALVVRLRRYRGRVGAGRPPLCGSANKQG